MLRISSVKTYLRFLLTEKLDEKWMQGWTWGVLEQEQILYSYNHKAENGVFGEKTILLQLFAEHFDRLPQRSKDKIEQKWCQRAGKRSGHWEGKNFPRSYCCFLHLRDGYQCSICSPRLACDWQSKRLKDTKKRQGQIKVTQRADAGIAWTKQEKKFQTEH